jgi:hypothetical protein
VRGGGEGRRSRIILTDVTSMAALVDVALGGARFGMQLLSGFALVALLMAALGIYGVVAFLVSRRTREVGIRMALGARAGDVLGLVLRQGMAPVLAGLAVGLALALALGRLGCGPALRGAPARRRDPGRRGRRLDLRPLSSPAPFPPGARPASTPPRP